MFYTTSNYSMDDYQLFDAEATKVFNSIDSDFSFAILLVPGTVHCPFIKEEVWSLIWFIQIWFMIIFLRDTLLLGRNVMITALKNDNQI